MIVIAAASFDITPNRQMQLAGYAKRTAPFNMIESPLEVNICLLCQGDLAVALVSIDCLFVGAAFEETVRRKLEGLSIGVIFVASHTHFAPSLDLGKPLLGGVDENYFCETVECVVGAVKNLAAGRKVPLRASYGSGRCPGGIYRRRRATVLRRRFPFLGLSAVMAPNRAITTHDEMQTLLIGGDDESPSAIVWCWPCHAVASPNPANLGADFPGYVRAALRKKYNNPQLAVLYFPGFSGDIRPFFAGSRFSVRNLAAHPFMAVEPFGRASEADYSRFCHGVAASAERLLDASSRTKSEEILSLHEVSVPLAKLLGEMENGSLNITYLDIGPISFLLFGAEVCSPYIDALQRLVKKPIIFSGCVGETYGYLPSDRQIAEGGYEVEGFQEFFSLQGQYSGNIESVILGEVESLLKIDQ